MKKMILIGPVGCGKTTLSQAITDEKIAYKKTQSVDICHGDIIDTPGEYLEMTRMRGALMTTSADAEVVILVQSARDEKIFFSPSFGGAFAKDVIGVVTQIDVATSNEVERTKKVLEMAGANRIFAVSSFTGEGIDNLREYLS